MDIEMLFPTPVGISYSPKDYGLTEYCTEILDEHSLTNTEEDLLKPEASRTTYYKSHNVLFDERFTELNNWVAGEIIEYSNRLGYCSDNMTAMAWVTESKKGDQHEIHSHPGGHISCVYYVEGKKEDAKMVIHKGMPCMFPIPVNEQTEVIADRYSYNPDKGKLIIFRSETMHSVTRKTMEDKRIFIAYNFTLSR